MQSYFGKVKILLETHDGQVQVSFLFGKGKLAAMHAMTLPHLELCAAKPGIEITELVTDELAITPHSVTYYTDSLEWIQ